MEEWKEYRLGEICKVINGRAYKQDELLNEGKYKVLRVGNIFQGNKWYYSDLELPDSKYCYNGDLLYAWSCDFAPYIWHGDKTIYHYHIWKLEENKDVVDRQYLYYYLQIRTKTFLGGTHGSVMLHMTKKDMEDQILSLPSLSSQKRIASILSSLDDKIALNRKINSNLEEQAKALFKSWFIDFEPFKGGKFVDSELGKIPEGWEVCPLEQMGKFKRGKTIVAKNTKEGTVPVVAGGMEPAYYNNVANTKGPVITVSASGANAGFMRLYFQDIWASDCSFLDNTNENLLWIYCFLDNNRRVLRHAQTGAVQPHVKPADINSILVCVPVHELIDKFQNVVRPLFLTIGLLQSETMRLQRTRDTLLPKLMSGEIKV